MGFFVKLLELVEVFVPDFFALGLVASAFFSLWCIGRTLGPARTVDAELSLEIPLVLGYLATVAINIVGSLLTPARATTPAAPPLESSVGQAGREALSETRKPQPVGHKGAVTES
jgi:hypothetical protein